MRRFKFNPYILGVLVAAVLAAAYYFWKKKNKADDPFELNKVPPTPFDNSKPVVGVATQALPADPQNFPLQLKREYLFKALREGGISANRSPMASELTVKFFPPHDINNTDLATFFGFYWPEVMAAKGLDNKFKIINPLLQQNGIGYVLKRENPTFGGIVGGLAGNFIGSIIPGGGAITKTFF